MYNMNEDDYTYLYKTVFVSNYIVAYENDKAK